MASRRGLILLRRALPGLRRRLLSAQTTTALTQAAPASLRLPALAGLHSSAGRGAEEKAAPEFDDEADREERRARMARNTVRAGWTFTAALVGGVVGAYAYYGAPGTDEEGNVIQDEFHEFSPPVAYWKRCMNEFHLTYNMFVEPSREKLLPDPVSAPYYQPPITLVVELKGVLVHPEWTYGTGWRFKIRPGADYFLRACGYPAFELVVYTSESGMTAAPIVESLNKGEGRIFYSLYRDTTKYSAGHHIKDLSRLNRPLEKVIIVDHDPASFQLQPENALCLPRWDGDPNDTALVDLAKLLEMIKDSGVSDVREIVQYYSQFDDPAGEFRRRSAALLAAKVQNESGEGKEKAKDKTPVSRFSGVSFGFRRHS